MSTHTRGSAASPKARESRWADYVDRPPTCAVCGLRVSLGVSSRQHWNADTQSGFVVHSACERVKVKIMVEATSVASVNTA